jgi:hypothetical protein
MCADGNAGEGLVVRQLRRRDQVAADLDVVPRGSLRRRRRDRARDRTDEHEPADLRVNRHLAPPPWVVVHTTGTRHAIFPNE